MKERTNSSEDKQTEDAIAKIPVKTFRTNPFLKNKGRVSGTSTLSHGNIREKRTRKDYSSQMSTMRNMSVFNDYIGREIA